MQGLFVLVSEISFLIPPSAHPARCGLLLTTLLVRFQTRYIFENLVFTKFTTVPPKKVLVNMFNSALSTTPSDSSGLTALAVWILSSIVFVFVALFFYVVILVKTKRMNKKSNPEILPLGKGKSKKPSGNPLDIDPLFLVVHFLAFALFTLTYLFVYLL